MPFFRGRNTWLDSGYMFRVSTFGGSGRVSHIFYVAADSNPEVFFLPSVAERRSVPSRCFWLQSCSAQFALGKPGSTH